jgi:hypothetical protein
MNGHQMEYYWQRGVGSNDRPWQLRTLIWATMDAKSINYVWKVLKPVADTDEDQSTVNGAKIGVWGRSTAQTGWRIQPWEGKARRLTYCRPAVPACSGDVAAGEGKAGRLTYCRPAVPACSGDVAAGEGKAGRLVAYDCKCLRIND